MKKSIRIIAHVGCLLALSAWPANTLLAQSPCPDIVGVWEYVLENQEGLYIATETHAMWLIVDKNRTPFENQPPTDREKARAYDSMVAAAVAHTCEGTTATVTLLYDADPNATGGGFRYEYERDGDTLTYWILNADGSRGTEGKARRIGDK